MRQASERFNLKTNITVVVKNEYKKSEVVVTSTKEINPREIRKKS